MDYSVNYLGRTPAQIKVTVPHDHPAVVSLRSLLPPGDRVCRRFGCGNANTAVSGWGLSWWQFTVDGALSFHYNKPRARLAPPLAAFEPIVLAAIPGLEKATLESLEAQARRLEKDRDDLTERITKDMASVAVDHVFRELRSAVMADPNVRAAIELARTEALKVATRELATINPDDPVLTPAMAPHQINACNNYEIDAERRNAILLDAHARIKAALSGPIPEKVYRLTSGPSL